MSLNKKILNEIERYKSISQYLTEQEETGDLPPLPDEGGETGTEDAGAEGLDDAGTEEIPEPVDVESDPDVEVVGDESEETVTDDLGDGTEELDVTELVTTQKDIADKQDEYMESMFSRLEDLTNKLGQMDSILQKIDNLEQKVEKYRQKSPEEKLQLRSLDSYPFNQKLTDFFVDKQGEFEQTGKEEYILTSDEVENYSDGDIKKSFDRPFEDEERM
jgi:phosphopantetheine adenylyltransferase